ncbi:MAG: DUF1800 family protein [Gemmobacter sp.]
MLTRTDIAALRFGIGLPLPPGAPTDPAGLLSALAEPDHAALGRPVQGTATALSLLVEGLEARRALRKSGDATMRQDAAAAIRAFNGIHVRVQIARALDAQDGLRERLVRFWADHFTTRARITIDAPLTFAKIEDAIRPNLTGRFSDLLVATTLHPAMLSYLDQSSSIGPNSEAGLRRRRGLNENLARELIELHTLGVDASYSQRDVEQLAALLTGLGVDGETGTVFRPQWAEPGAETVLGRSYGGEGLAPIVAVLHDLAARPETAGHLARKIAVHMVSDDPDPALVATIAAAWSASDGDLMAVYGALLDHPAAWTPDLAKMRQPFDFVLAGLRALGVTGADVMDMPDRTLRRSILNPLAAMGQPWQAPNGPDGWPEEAEAWIRPQLLAARIAWAMQAPASLRRDLPDAADMAHAALGPLAEGRLLWAVERAETRAEAVGLVLASPMFNRR